MMRCWAPVLCRWMCYPPGSTSGSERRMQGCLRPRQRQPETSRIVFVGARRAPAGWVEGKLVHIRAVSQTILFREVNSTPSAAACTNSVMHSCVACSTKRDQVLLSRRRPSMALNPARVGCRCPTWSCRHSSASNHSRQLQILAHRGFWPETNILTTVP